MTVGHFEQERPDTCVAAALRIVLAARGDLRSEADIRDQLGPFPWRVGTVVGFGSAWDVDFAQLRTLLWLRAKVSDRPCIVEVVATEAAEAAIAAGLAAPHGPMPGPMARPRYFHHAIVLIGVVGEDLHYLDPFYGAIGQPLSVPQAVFVDRWWTGGVLVPA